MPPVSQSEASNQFACAIRESEARLQHGQLQLDQAHSIGNQYEMEVSELRRFAAQCRKNVGRPALPVPGTNPPGGSQGLYPRRRACRPGYGVVFYDG